MDKIGSVYFYRRDNIKINAVTILFDELALMLSSAWHYAFGLVYISGRVLDLSCAI